MQSLFLEQDRVTASKRATYDSFQMTKHTNKSGYVGGDRSHGDKTSYIQTNEINQNSGVKMGDKPHLMVQTHNFSPR